MFIVPKKISNLFYSISQKIKGNREVFDYLKEINKTQYLPPESLKELQWKKLKKLLYHADKTTVFYDNLFKKNNIDLNNIKSYEDFLNIPILEKETIRNNLDSMISSDYKKDDLIKNFSSGSTGTPLEFYQTKSFKLRAKAHQLRNYKWCGYDIGDKFSLLWGSELYFTNKTFFEKIENFLINRIELNTFRLTEGLLKKYASTLSVFKPKLISTYPSSIFLIARIIEKYNLPKIKVGAIQTTSEVVDDSRREYLESFFECPIYDKYGSRETNVISHECPNHEGMHINVENTFVEFLRDGKPVKSGEVGEVVITNLNNFGMPLIRYRMNDLATPLEGQCSCGITLPRMNNLKGRKSDMIITTDGGFVDSYLFSYILMRFNEIDIFQVVQEDKEFIKIKIKLKDRKRENFEEEICEIIHRLADPNFKVIFDYIENIPIEGSGKHRATISKVDYQW